VEDSAAGRLEQDRDRVGDRVRDAHELDVERAQLDGRFLRVGLPQLRGAQQPVLVQLRLDEPERQPRRPHLLHARLPQDEREGTDVVLVPVGEQDRANRPLELGQVREVGQDQVDAEVLVTREREARVDDDRFTVGLVDGHVLADLAQAAQRDDPRSPAHPLILGPSGENGAARPVASDGRTSKPVRPGNGAASGALAAKPDRLAADTASVRLSFLAYATIAAGLGVMVGGGFAVLHRPLTALALLGAGALAAELLEEPEATRLREPVGAAGVFRVSSGVDLAAVIVLGPWRGALVAGAAALLARVVRGPWRVAAFQSSGYALASLAAGYGFSLGDGTPGHLVLPDDLPALAVLAIAYLVVSRGVLQVIGGLEVLQADFAAAAAETGLGALIALAALGHPWNALAVIPVALAVNQAHLRLRRSRQETLHALETFANIVDERDSSTYRHSLRVAASVDALARALGLPYSDIDRLRWAARLHDLGKVAVDASALRKPGKLTPDQWGAMWRAPRLSARLLRRFELSAAEARAVELHHERFDGRGYYAVPGEELPLASHFLIVADSFDAMLSDRPYRPGLSVEEALSEIEANIGRQFHPAVAKAFIAVQRGQDPYAALTPEEQEELRSAAAPHRVPELPGARDLKERPELVALGGLAAALVGVGVDQLLLAYAGAALACAGILMRGWVRYRSRRLRRALAAVLASNEREAVFARIADTLHAATRADWVGLVDWEEGGVDGVLERSRGEPPRERALMSWLVREAESREQLLTAAGHELGGQKGVYVGLPLRRENSALTGFLVLRVPRVLRRHVRTALTASLDAIGVALAAQPTVQDGAAELRDLARL
jgi:HD-GYP domain-containing protein (c-di-GMP phosphodiesterase class II)